jgi:hypothetical protein
MHGEHKVKSTQLGRQIISTREDGTETLSRNVGK